MATVTTYVNSTFTPSLQGYVGRENVNEAFSTIRSGSGTVAVQDVGLVDITGSTTTNQYKYLDRAIMLFDTSSIPSSATVTAAELHFSITDNLTAVGSSSLVIVSSTPASTSALSSSDYSNLGTTSLGSLSQASIVTGVSNTVSVSTSAITVNGLTKLGALIGFDQSNTAPTWASLGNTEIQWSAVKLLVSYSYTQPSLSLTGISSLTGVSSITTS